MLTCNITNVPMKNDVHKPQATLYMPWYARIRGGGHPPPGSAHKLIKMYWTDCIPDQRVHDIHCITRHKMKSCKYEINWSQCNEL